MKLYLEHETNKDKEIHFFYDFEDFKTVVKKENLDLNEWYISYPNDTEELYQILFDDFEIDSEDLEKFYELIENYDAQDLLKVVMYLHYSYVSHNITTFDVDNAIDCIMFYEVDTLHEVAKELYDQGVYEKVPDWLEDKIEFVYGAIEAEIEPNWDVIEIGSSTYFYEYVG